MQKLLEKPNNEHKQHSYNRGFKMGYQHAVNDKTIDEPPDKFNRKAFEQGYMDGYEKGIKELTIR